MGNTIIRSNQYLEAPIVDPKHLVNKEYVDNMINRAMKAPCRVTTTADLGATYDLPTQTLTASNPGVLIIDGITVNDGDRILVKDQTDGTQNGIYDITISGSPTTPFKLKRSSDFDETADIQKNLFVRVSEGTMQADLLFQLINDGNIVLDSTVLIFQKYSNSDGGVKKVGFDITGDGIENTFTLTHNLKTTDIDVTMKSGADTILGNWDPTTINTVTISFDSPLPNGYILRVIIIG